MPGNTSDQSTALDGATGLRAGSGGSKPRPNGDRHTRQTEASIGFRSPHTPQGHVASTTAWAGAGGGGCPPAPSPFAPVEVEMSTAAAMAPSETWGSGSAREG